MVMAGFLVDSGIMSMEAYIEKIGKIPFWVGVLALLACGELFPSLSYSAAPAPRTVDVGIYVNNIPAVNLKEKKFQADFYVWFRWSGDDIEPIESFSIVNGHIDSKDALVKKKIGNINYGSYRVEATIYRNFDLARYPLDNQTLKIQIEDTKSRGADLVFRPDKINAGISQKINIPGWRIGKFDSYESITKYPSNYGDLSLPNNAESAVPRYTFAVDVLRGGYGNFIKLFSMLFLAAALSFCAFRIRSDHIDARFALVVSGVFLAALTQSTLSTNLPESDSFNMADQLYLVTMVFIAFTCYCCIHIHQIFVDGDEARAAKISRALIISLSAAYMLANVIIVGIS